MTYTSRKKLLLLSMIISFLAGCKKPQSSAQIDITGKTMGTFYSVKVSGNIAISKNQLQKQIDMILEQVNNDISTYRTNSVLSRFNHSRSVKEQPIPRSMTNIILMAQRIGCETDGGMDITIGSLVNLWGFGPYKSEGMVPTPKQIEIAKKKIGLQHLKLFIDSRGEWLQKNKPDIYLDLSTLGEGYGADELARLMTRNGIINYLVSVGGAISSHGLNPLGRPWRVAVQKPTDRENVPQILVDLKGYSISTAGSYRNYFEQGTQHYSHVIDPRTGAPIKHDLLSVTVIAPTALEADGWDTGLMVLGAEKALSLAQEKGLAVYLISKTNDDIITLMTPLFKTFLVQ